MTPKESMGDELADLYRMLRYALETSMAPSDAEEAVSTLDELIKQVQRDDVTKLLLHHDKRSKELFPDFPDTWDAESDTWDAAADLINPDVP